MDPIHLKIIPTQGSAYDFEFSGQSLLIGRSSSADLVIEDESMSRKHARLYREGGQVYIEDLGSQNGTWVNSRKITQPTPAPAGALIRLSNTLITTGSRSPAPPPEPSFLANDDELSERTLFRNATEMLRLQDEAPVEAAEPGDDPQNHLKRLKILNEVHRDVADMDDKDALLELILDRLFDHLHPEQSVIFLKREDGSLYPAASRSLSGLKRKFTYSRRLASEVTEKGMAALVYDVRLDKRFSASASMVASGLRSLAAAPLLSRKGCLGMIVLASRAQIRQFTEDDLALLVSLASVASLRIRNLALAVEAAKRQQLEQELKLARRIQTALLPSKLPEIPGYRLYGNNIPSQGVSGDYFEALTRLDGKECVLLIADVSGKGMSASLLTATMEALSAGPIEDGLPPHDICLKLSRMLFKRTPADRYATMFMAALELDTGMLRYCNAGHNPALAIGADGAVQELSATGLPLGLLPKGDYTLGEIQLNPGDTLVMYTDGITEAANRDEEEYGMPRLKAFCQARRDLGLEDLAKELQGDLARFADGVPFGDDRTLVIARREA